MSSSRTITVTLTQPQFEALASCVAMGKAELEDRDEPFYTRELATARRAWSRIKQSWYA